MESPVIDLKDAARWLRESTDEELHATGLSLQGTFDEIDDPVLLGPDGKPFDTWREGYPYEKRMSRKKYNKSKRALQIELIKAQNWIKETGQRVVVLFEGRDAAGKGSTIKRFVEHLNPRGTRVVALEAPTEREDGQWYFQRYLQHLPTAGEITLFDRSWYNRAGVEPVMGYCSPAEHEAFMQEVPVLERMLVRDGIILVKLWFSVSQYEQISRFLVRRLDPVKRWKLSPNDLASIDRWHTFTDARKAMLERTHHPDGPWTVVLANDKKRGRTEAMRHVLSVLDYPDKNAELTRVDPLIVRAPNEHAARKVLLDARKIACDTWPEGSLRADLEKDLSAPGDPVDGGRHPLPSLEAWCTTVGAWGIGPSTEVVVTDDQDGGLAAARCWWMLRAIGHTLVKVVPLEELDLPSSAVRSEVDPLPPYPARTWVGKTASAQDVERRRQDANWRVIDARSAARFRGEVEPLDPIAGHIEGAHNVPWQETTDLDEARERLAQVMGDVPTKRVIVQCGSGVTACHTLLQMHRLGLRGARLYVGSWSEWCLRDGSARVSPG